MPHVPASLYHLLINEKFPLKEALNLLPYLEHLGIGGIYCSPLFEAFAPHGYDVVNPHKINPQIGTHEEFEAFCSELKKRGLFLVLDVIPNHMGIKGKNNFWWQDVLKKGEASSFAEFFDIDWNPLKKELKGKVLLPILGDSYGQTLLNQEITLVEEEGTFWIKYGTDYYLPINDQGIALIHSKGIENFQGVKGDPQSFDLLHELLELQYYRLANWLVAGQEINYRRFFNINELVAIHTENERVLNEHHKYLFELLKSEKVQGLRIDHPDGLYDPTHYFQRLKNHAPTLVVVEKILDLNEELPASWKVEGTVGYEFLNLLNGLFVQKKHELLFSRIYDKFIGYKTDFDLLLYQRKKWFITMQMGSEINRLGYMLDRFSEESRFLRDFTRVDLTNALKEIIACFPVYRTYARPSEEVSKKDQDYIAQAIEAAKQKAPEISPTIFSYIGTLLQTMQPPQSKQEDFVLRFQQQTGPVMAKGLEDSCFYIYNRLLSLNEVGGNPRLFGISKSQFDQFNIVKNKKWPFGFLPTSTQDTKWSEDARARLNVLSELPKVWEKEVFSWARLNEKYKKKIQGELFPDRNTEYYLYQLMLAIWPDDLERVSGTPFFDRLWEGFLKSMREAGLYTSWRRVENMVEEAARDFLTAITQDREFLTPFLALQTHISLLGKRNSLSQLIGKVGSCGIVDLYQGNESWCYRCMDPDNRQTVDFKMQPNQKMEITQMALHFRNTYSELFTLGEYIPLAVHKEKKDNVVAFLRRNREEIAVVVFGRFFSELPDPPLGKEAWGETRLILPKEVKELKCIFTSSAQKIQKVGARSSLYIADVFEEHPFSILTNLPLPQVPQCLSE